MKKIFVFLLISVFIWVQTAFTQRCPPNIDFEDGNFSNWECFSGTTSTLNGINIMSLYPSPPDVGRHEIISAKSPVTIDPYGKFPMLCPYGGNYSVKLGNNRTGAEAEGLSYTFQVPNTPDTFSFTYFYAVVFEDPQHAPIEQPRFFVTAYDVLTGDLINCASYDYISNGAIPGFQRSSLNSNVWFKSWSPVSIQFAGLANRMVRLEFKTADCTRSGHFGYAYVDVGSGCSNILATAPYCIETNSLLLNAPYGFKSYTWYTSDYSAIVGNQQSIVLSPPPTTSGLFYVDIDPYPGYGCRDTVQAVVQPLPVPDTPVAKDYDYCQFETVPALTATPQSGSDLLWYTTAFGGTGSSIAPTPSTSVQGLFSYYVSQKVLFGCESLRKKISVRIHPTPAVSFSVNVNRQCQVNNEFIVTSTSTNLSNSRYTWNFGDGVIQSSSVPSATHTYSTYGSFTVKLAVQNQPACSREKTMTVVVEPKPVAAFTYPTTICEKQTPVLLKDMSSVPGGLSTLNKWWWEVEGKNIHVQNPGAIILNNGGKVPVKLVVTSAHGCISDTNTTTFDVRYRPNASYSFGNLLCDNEVLQFTDRSFMQPGASPDYVNKWSWEFDDGTNSAWQHPSKIFPAGVRRAKLMVESNFGCKSLDTTGSFVIHAKPRIQLEINDSCILRTINYSAVDVHHTVDKWYWDFGTGLLQGSALVTKTYKKEGYNPLTLMAQSLHGCKDTIIRPFTVYHNKALAYRDTIAARDEPVQLYSNGGQNVQYTWSPSVGLNDASLENPVATLDRDQSYRLDAVTDKGCDSHSEVLIKRYKGPELYIPNAFTPDGDGKNDLLKVFPVGIKTFKFFDVYNRYGQLVFRSTDYTKGWDGRYNNGKEADQGNYVAVSQAIDYKGKLMTKKTNVILLR